MKTEYLDELYPNQLKERLSRIGVELTEDQYRALLHNERTFLYAPRERKKEKTSILYRVSILVFFLWALFVRFIIQPVKWIITGDEFFKMDNPIYRFTVKWGRKIGL